MLSSNICALSTAKGMKLFMKKKYETIKLDYLISVFISLSSIFLKGSININSQILSNMNTYSGGFPIAWFEFYYPSDVRLSIGYIANNFSDHYKIELFAFFLNFLVIFLIIQLVKKLLCLCSERVYYKKK